MLASLLEEVSIITEGLTGGGGIGRTCRIIQSGRAYLGFKPSNWQSSSLILFRILRTYHTFNMLALCNNSFIMKSAISFVKNEESNIACRMGYPFCSKCLFSFHRFWKLFLIITFLPLSLVLRNHFHTFYSELWLLSTTATTTLFCWLFRILTLNLKFITTFTFRFILAGIQYLFKSIFRILYFQCLLKLVVFLQEQQLK